MRKRKMNKRTLCKISEEEEAIRELEQNELKNIVFQCKKCNRKDIEAKHLCAPHKAVGEYTIDQID